jgi:hypothetical protein
MAPGYVSDGEFDPYVSPIYVVSIEPLKTGRDLLRLRFIVKFWSGRLPFEGQIYHWDYAKRVCRLLPHIVRGRAKT